MYQVGDKVVYPHHGAGTVVKKEKREVLGEQREYLTIQILHNDMTVQVPSENCDKVGLRRVIVGDKEIAPVLKALTGISTEMPKNWNRRFKHNRDKMKTGDILELAEVVRNLALRDREKGLSTGEKQMFVKAKKILASELMYAKDMDEETCAEWLEDVLASDGPPPRKKAAPKKKAAAAADGLGGAACTHVGLGDPRRCRAGGTSRPGPAQGVRESRRRAAPRGAAPPPRGVPVGRRDRRRRAPGLGGAGDPPRRGGGLRQGARVRRRRRDAERLRSRRPRRGRRTTRS